MMRTQRIGLGALAVLLAWSGLLVWTDLAMAQAAKLDILAKVKQRGKLACGVNNQVPGFGYLTPAGKYEGFDTDFCRAIAAAVLGDATKVEFIPMTAKERFTALQTGEIDVLIRNTTWTISRDTSVGAEFAPTTFYDGQGMMVRKASGIKDLKGLNGGSICVQTGTTTELNLADQFRRRGIQYKAVVFENPDATFGAYEQGRCDGVTTDQSQLISRKTVLKNPADHVILPEVMSKEPLGPVTIHGDNNWHDIVKWVVFGLITAEEMEITSKNIEQFTGSKDPEIARLLGSEGELGKAMGLDVRFVYNAVKQVGNYGETFARNLGPGTPFNLSRGVNDLWTRGGLLYAPPFR